MNALLHMKQEHTGCVHQVGDPGCRHDREAGPYGVIQPGGGGRVGVPSATRLLMHRHAAILQSGAPHVIPDL
jgi:hypothetical protein